MKKAIVIASLLVLVLVLAEMSSTLGEPNNTSDSSVLYLRIVTEDGDVVEVWVNVTSPTKDVIVKVNGVDVVGELNSLNSRLGGVNRALNDLSHAVEENSRQIGEIYDVLENHKMALDEVYSILSNHSKSLNETYTILENHADAIKKTIYKLVVLYNASRLLAKSLNKTRMQLRDFEVKANSTFKKIEDDLRVLGIAIGKLGKALDKTNEEIKTLRDENAKLKEEIARLNDELNNRVRFLTLLGSLVTIALAIGISIAYYRLKKGMVQATK
ncbi:MAG TPA: hypothetical protein ENF41_03030 [Candidatus Bathyarchaeota archaeon]|nr:hypothetical protein [Candidatus Bathyarchaeota archaeon]